MDAHGAQCGSGAGSGGGGSWSIAFWRVDAASFFGGGGGLGGRDGRLEGWDAGLVRSWEGVYGGGNE